VSDGIIAPDFCPEALEILKKKKGGKYCVLQVIVKIIGFLYRYVNYWLVYALNLPVFAVRIRSNSVAYFN